MSVLLWNLRPSSRVPVTGKCLGRIEDAGPADLAVLPVSERRVRSRYPGKIVLGLSCIESMT
jgi:hypothetical protein